MIPASVHQIRNIGLFGQAGAGKTALFEALIASAEGRGNDPGNGHGPVVSDFDPIEKELGHSFSTTVAHLDWGDQHINLLDTPGTPDFLGRALLALPAVETAAIVINAQAGVESVSRKIMQAAADRCRAIIVTKIDAADVDFGRLMAAIRQVFGGECLPVNLPGPGGETVADCFFTPQADAPTAFGEVSGAHEAIVDQVVEMDEALMALYLEQGEVLDPAQLHAPFEKALRDGHLVPVCFVSARTGAGIQALLDVFARLLPDPTEGIPPRFLKGEGPAATPYPVSPDPAAHVVAHVFQVANDPYRGKLGIFRIHQGTVTANSQLFIGDARKPFKVSHLLRLRGRSQEEIETGIPGDICAVARVDEIQRDAVLHDSHDEDLIHLQPATYPQPVFGLALIPRKHGDEQKLAEALHRLSDEDPCIAIDYDEQAKQTVVRGLGERHLKAILDQLESRWNLALDTAAPAIPYRETITANAEFRYRHRKQSGGAGQFGEVALRIQPLPRGSGIEFADEVKGGVIPGSYIPAVEKGVRLALAEGALAGFPVHDVRITVFDGKHHAVDSNEISFVTAARHATLESVCAALPQLLEPMLKVCVQAMENHFGEISAEFSSRRGRLLATDSPQAGWTLITALVPMSEMEGFEARLKAICAGDSECTIEAGGYEAAPNDVQQRLANAFRSHGAV